MAAMPSLLREYRASTEASSSGVTFGRSAALGGGTNASPVTFIIEKPNQAAFVPGNKLETVMAVKIFRACPSGGPVPLPAP